MIEIIDEDRAGIIEEYRMSHVEFGDLQVVNNRPMNIWRYAKCRRYIDPGEPEAGQIEDAEVELSGEYDDNP